MIKRKLSMYALGGIELDDETNPKKVKAAPAGYVIDKDYIDKTNPKRIYYKKTDSGATTVAPTTVASHNAPSVFRRRGTSASTSVVPINRPTANNSIDRVYTEPDEPVQKPQTAWRGTQIFTNVGGSNRAIGEAQYPIRNSINSSDGGMIDNTTNQGYKFQYYKPNSADVDGNMINIPSADWNNRGQTSNYADTSFINKYLPKPKMAMGGDTSLDDLDDDQLAQIQQYADENGMTPEEAYEDMQGQQMGAQDGTGEEDQWSGLMNNVLGNDDEDDNTEYKYGGGFKLNPAHKGFCTPMTKSTCTGKRRQFAINDKNHFKKQHAMGGINVEGGEVLQTPNGQLSKVKGPAHEQGGVDVKVPTGTKIFSDRLAIDGETMQERKMKREMRLAKMDKLLKANPTNQLTKNTVNRTSNIINNEDQKDMMLQKVANKMYSAPQQNQQQPDDEDNGYAYGGKVRSYAVGGQSNDPLLQFLGNTNPDTWSDNSGNSYNPSYRDTTNEQFNLNYANGIDNISSNRNIGNPTISSSSPILTPNASAMVKPNTNSGGLTLGDDIGIGANILGAVLPIMNTKAAARATRPNINRYTGFGHDALDSNQSAIDYVTGNKTNEDINIDTEANSSYRRNANSASDISVLRALDTTTDMGKRKALNASTDTANRAMGNLLGQRGQLQNQRDQYVDYGQTKVDEENKADSDNYYSNMAANIGNFTGNVESIGRNININKSNKVDRNLISQLSRWGLDVDDEGNIINRKKRS